MPVNRRQFLCQTTAAGIGLAGALPAVAQSDATAATRVYIDPARRLADLDRRLFGSFLEHIGRAIYGGIYEPDSKLSDTDGFRKDTLDEVRRLAVPMVRYPGGNFVSGYHWQDGVGPKKDRPRVLDRAWNSLETNQFGTDEFIAWCRRVGTEPLLAVNLGTGSAENAANLVEYCNVDKGTRWSDLRVRNGTTEPHGVKSWCLGNEMDGPWQIGHTTAAEYGRKAADAARQMRVVDRSLQLVACGSSGPFMGTYLEWDRQMLEQCYADVDAISLHRYFNYDEAGRDSTRFVAMNLSMEKQIREVAAVCDLVQGRLRSRKQLWLSFDEWNVWYRERDGDGKRTHAPHLIEEIYNLEDALLVGGTLNSLLRHARRVRIACLAQLVNVIAPLMTNADQVVRQTIFYPYAFALQYARGQVLDLLVESPTYDGGNLGPVPYLDVAATLDPKTGAVFCLLILNRDLDRERELTVIWRDSPPTRVLVSEVLTGADLKATNTFAEPRRVVPQPLEPPKVGERMTFKVPARAYAVVQVTG